MKNIAIIGYGFVGKAVANAFKYMNITVIDPKEGPSTISDLKNKDIHCSFICVPTPMGPDGTIDSTIVENVVEELQIHTNGLIVLKSTVTPDVIERINSSRFIYNPEFLREASAFDDFINPDMHIFGTDSEVNVELLTDIYEYSSCDMIHAPILKVTPVEASLIKYGINTFLASKVLFFNQLKDIIDKYGDYDTVRTAMIHDPRVGHSHTLVPGPDGRKGFGSACFAKDTVAFAKHARYQNIPFTVLEEVIRKNQEYRNFYGEPLQREKDQNVHFNYDI